MNRCMHCGKEYLFPLETGCCPGGCDSRRLKKDCPWLFEYHGDKNEKNCSNCKWYDSSEGVCFNKSRGHTAKMGKYESCDNWKGR